MVLDTVRSKVSSVLHCCVVVKVERGLVHCLITLCKEYMVGGLGVHRCAYWALDIVHHYGTCCGSLKAAPKDGVLTG